MVSDVLVILLFSATTELAHTLTDPSHPVTLSGGHPAAAAAHLCSIFVPRVAAELAASALLGLLLAALCLLALRVPEVPPLPQLGLLGVGAAAFSAQGLLDQLLVPLGVTAPSLEPMLACVITGFVVCNGGEVFTGRDERRQLEALVNSSMHPTLLFFFTTTGLGMRLSVLQHTWPAAVGLFVVRLAALYFGHAVGARWGAMPHRLRSFGWMAYATLMSVIVLNQLVGAASEGPRHEPGARRHDSRKTLTRAGSESESENGDGSVVGFGGLVPDGPSSPTAGMALAELVSDKERGFL
ncbi:hypothetical protein EMIHUDRAFT_452969 [Emiliania huxleyi CCMP1516]|uniref:Cation/H+ exchanger domain-containing protein n=2 Tax=Emiliania huxleyi TaxID=2903 RepID=A0A0D3ICW3_EMIH1|nr:hypothetical protein EMIHUDRAFT_452969 [Emiliania huxleyi CCMP1516]EOD09098.1 hypothetical protein EMIHUDRAFT_452969 [Emiliania huxleyi CCMP1516]|eukprot:XP_005761527.1 hypothetical protein EMIHUDRAFT_452969 [Emiliania huxleyi CCMP1516]